MSEFGNPPANEESNGSEWSAAQDLDSMSLEDYQQARAEYRAKKKAEESE